MLTVLDRLMSGVEFFADFSMMMMTSRYGESLSSMQRRSAEQQFFIGKKDDLSSQERKRIRDIIYYLERNNLVVKNKSRFQITPKGIKKAKELRLKFPHLKPYEKVKSENPILISFDIPEKFRPKRRWLREVLSNLGFKFIHRSVWIGFVKIPEQFIKDLEELKISRYVEIIELSNTGTIKKLKN